MKSAEEVADELCRWWSSFDISDARIRTQIIYELKQFADERLEEAARIAHGDSFMWKDSDELRTKIAKEIRALKSGK